MVYTGAVQAQARRGSSIARGLALAAVLLGIGAISAPRAPAAENFACGPGGTPDAKTSRCQCPAGKVEKTAGGTSRCVDRPAAPKPGPKPSATTSATTQPTTAPTSVTMPTTTATPLPSATAVPVPVPVPTPVPTCAPGSLWNGAQCVSVGVGGLGGCADGRVGDGAHCCWPAQAWSAADGRCRGVPSCPVGMQPEGEECVAGTCVEGQARVDGVHCCWPNQAWSPQAGLCVGVPACPEGYAASGERCVPLRLCDPGMSAVDTLHCCWPGQHWMVRSGGDVGCGGEPKCPAPLVPHAEDCVSPADLTAQNDHVAQVGRWGAGYATFDFDFAYASTGSNTTAGKDATWNWYGLGFAFHPSAFPLRLGAGWSYGVTHYTVTDCQSRSGCTLGDSASSSLFGYTLEASLAPLSFPNALEKSFSFLNPFIGLKVRGSMVVSSNSSGARNAEGGFDKNLVVGNLFLFGHLGIPVAYMQNLSPADGRPSSTFQIGISAVGGPF